jgi:hypothetical protein
VLGKGERPKKASTIYIDRSRIHRHIIPLLGTRRVRDLTPSDINRFIRDVMSGKTKAGVKTKKRGRIVRGGAGTAARAAGLFGGILTYAIENGIIGKNPVHGVRKPADRVKTRRLSEEEYRMLGKILRAAGADDRFKLVKPIIRFLTLVQDPRGSIWLPAQAAPSQHRGSPRRAEYSRRHIRGRVLGSCLGVPPR